MKSEDNGEEYVRLQIQNFLNSDSVFLEWEHNQTDLVRFQADIMSGIAFTQYFHLDLTKRYRRSEIPDGFPVLRKRLGYGELIETSRPYMLHELVIQEALKCNGIFNFFTLE